MKNFFLLDPFSALFLVMQMVAVCTSSPAVGLQTSMGKTALAIGPAKLASPVGNLLVETAGKTYYVSSLHGDDKYTAEQAQSQGTPWKTTARIQSISLKPGDGVLFERGGEYQDVVTSDNGIPLVLYLNNADGTEKDPITLGAYGVGAKPKLTSMKRAIEPVAMAARPHIYEYPVKVWENLVVVYLDGLLTPVARYPRVGSNLQKGYLMNKTKTGGGQGESAAINSPNIPGFDLVGGDLVTKCNHYIENAHPITAQTSNSITFINTSSAPIQNEFGFFFQNHVNCLKRDGDWSFDKARGKLQVYWSDGPARHKVQYASANYLVWHLSSAHVRYRDIAFEGVNVHAVKLQNFSDPDVVFTNCSFLNSGMDHVFETNGAPQTTIDNCYMGYSYSMAADLSEGTPGSKVINSVVEYNSMVIGAHRYTFNKSLDNKGKPINNLIQGANGGAAIAVNGDDVVVDNNTILYTGYNGVNFNGRRARVSNNYIYKSTSNTMDGAGIYTFGVGNNLAAADMRTVSNNIVVAAEGDAGGTPDTAYHPTYGIYIDDRSTYVNVTNNTCSGAGDAAIYLHHTRDVTVSGNTTFDNKKALMIKVGDNDSQLLPGGNSIANNIFVAKDSSQFFYDLRIVNHPAFATTQVADLATFRNNKLFAPFRLDDFAIRVEKHNPANTESQRWHNLQSWQQSFGQDAGSAIGALSGYKVTSAKNLLTETFATNALTGTLAGSAKFANRSLAVANGELATAVTKKASTRSTLLLFSGGTDIRAGGSYRVRFKARSAGGSFVVNAYLGNYRNGDEMTHFQVTGKSTPVELIFPAVRFSSKGFSLNLETEDENGAFFMDDFSIDEVSLSYPNASNRLQLFYNPHSITSAIPYAGGRFANLVTGQPLPPSPISLPPKSSIVAIRQ